MIVNQRYNIMWIQKLDLFLCSIGDFDLASSFHFLKLILWKRFFTQVDESMSMWSNIKCRSLAIRALATDTAITEAVKPPLLQRVNKNFWTIWSKLPNKSRCPLGKTFRFGAMGHFSVLAFSSSAINMARNTLMVLSLTGQPFDPNFFAAVGPLMAAYFPIVNLSWLDHFQYDFHFSLFELDTAETTTLKLRALRLDSSCKSCDGAMEENFMF